MKGGTKLKKSNRLYFTGSVRLPVKPGTKNALAVSRTSAYCSEQDPRINHNFKQPSASAEQ